MVASLDRQNRTEGQLIHFIREEHDGLEAGLRLGRAARERREIGKAIIVGHVSERETVSKEQRVLFCRRYRLLILRIERIQFFLVGLRVSHVGIRISRISLRNRACNVICQDRRVSKGKPYMLVVFGLFLFALLFFSFHSGDKFLFFHLISQNVQKIDHNHVLVHRFFEGIFHPFVGLAAHIDEDITGRDLHDIVRRRLVAVKVHAGVQQHVYFGISGIFAQNVLHPIIDRKDGRDDLQLVSLRFFLSAGLLRPGEQKSAANHNSNNNSKYRNPFFHDNLRLFCRQNTVCPPIMGQF